MIKLKEGLSKSGERMHYSVGGLINIDGKYLLIDRIYKPLGFACPAGHIDLGEIPEESFLREIKEETGLKINKFRLLFEEETNATCGLGANHHYYYVYECQDISGKIIFDISEAKSIGLYSEKEIQHFAHQKRMEPIWEYWFRKKGVIK